MKFGLITSELPLFRTTTGALLKVLDAQGITCDAVIVLQLRTLLQRFLRHSSKSDAITKVLARRLSPLRARGDTPIGLDCYRNLVGPDAVVADQARFAEYLSRNSERVVKTRDLTDPEFLNRVKGLGLDFCFMEGAGILRQPFLDLFPGGVLNCHTSGPLPRYRGLGSLEMALIDNQPLTLNLHLIDPGIDTGPVVAQEPLPLEGNESLEKIYAILFRDSRAVIAQTVSGMMAGDLLPVPQDSGAGRQYFAAHPLIAAYAEKCFLAQKPSTRLS